MEHVIYKSRDTARYTCSRFLFQVVLKNRKANFREIGARIRLWGQPRWSSPLRSSESSIVSLLARGHFRMTKDGKGFARNRIDSASKRDTVLVLLRQFDTRWLSVSRWRRFSEQRYNIELLCTHVYKTRKSLEFIDFARFCSLWKYKFLPRKVFEGFCFDRERI